MYFTGIVANSAGALLTALDVHLLAAGWSYLGTSATNKKVYSSVGTSGLETIIVEIDDSNVAYTGFRLATAYNDVSKQFTNPTTVRYCLKASAYSTPYWLAVDLNRFVLATKCIRGGTNNYDTVYIGLPTRYKTTDTGAVIVIGSTGTSTPQGILHSTLFTGNAGQLLRDNSGSYNQTFGAVSLNACFSSGQLPNIIDGKMIISPVLVGKASGEITGELTGLFSILGASVAQEDTLTKDGNTYLVMTTGTYFVAILQA